MGNIDKCFVKKVLILLDNSCSNLISNTGSESENLENLSLCFWYLDEVNNIDFNVNESRILFGNLFNMYYSDFLYKETEISKNKFGVFESLDKATKELKKILC